MAFPLRLQRSDIDDDAAARIGRFTNAYHQCITRDPEILHRTGQGKAIGGNDADIRFAVHKAIIIKGFRIHRGRIDIGKNLKLVRYPRIIAVRGDTVRNHPLAGEIFDIGFDHATFGLLANPVIWHNAHRVLHLQQLTVLFI